MERERQRLERRRGRRVPAEPYDPGMNESYRQPFRSRREEKRLRSDRFGYGEREYDRDYDRDFDRDLSPDFERDYYGPEGRDWRTHDYEGMHRDFDEDQGRYGPAFGSPETEFGRGYESYGGRRQNEARDISRRGAHYGKGPKGYQRSSERIKEDVALALTHNGAVDAFDIEIKVENGEVTLEGSVPIRYMKRLAEYISESVAGVHDVHNRLRVAPHEARESDWQPVH